MHTIVDDLGASLRDVVDLDANIGITFTAEGSFDIPGKEVFMRDCQRGTGSALT